MEKMIEEYENLYQLVVKRIAALQNVIDNEPLSRREKERLEARVEVLKEERFELVLTIHELKQHR
jgi:hypothetical protein